MRTKFYLPFIALALMATSCNSKKEAEQKGGIRLANLDQTANPRDDFYQYACGGWMKANPLTDEYPDSVRLINWLKIIVPRSKV